MAILVYFNFCAVVYKFFGNVCLTSDDDRHCLWILGNERTLSDSESVWKALVLDAKCRQCFFNADEDKDLAKAILEVKKEFDQFDDLLNADSILFRIARWKVKLLVVSIHVYMFFFSPSSLPLFQRTSTNGNFNVFA